MSIIHEAKVQQGKAMLIVDQHRSSDFFRKLISEEVNRRRISCKCGAFLHTIDESGDRLIISSKLVQNHGRIPENIIQRSRGKYARKKFEKNIIIIMRGGKVSKTYFLYVP